LFVGVGYIYVCPGMVGCFLVLLKGPELILMLGLYRFPSLLHLKISYPRNCGHHHPSFSLYHIVSPHITSNREPRPSAQPNTMTKKPFFRIYRSRKEKMLLHIGVKKKKRSQETVEEGEKNRKEVDIEFLFLPNKLNNPTSLLDLLLRTRGNISRLNDNGDLWETAFAKNLRVSQRK